MNDRPPPDNAVEPPAKKHPVAATITFIGLYGGFTTWTYFAWYYNQERNKDKPGHPGFRWGGDRLFQVDTYAGGADKLGHMWATMGLARGGTELLHQLGGFDKLTSSAISCGLAELLFAGVEIKDGAYYEFSYGDFLFNSIGAVTAFALSNLPRLDELIDYRVQYWPSKAYRRQLLNDGNVNIAEDYTGQTYLLAFHLAGVHSLRDSKYGFWTRFVDVAVGFETRGYKPDPLPEEPDFDHHQKLFLGVTLNAQGVFDYLFEGRSKPARKISHGLFEMFNAPYSTLTVVDSRRSALVTDEGGVMRR
ncbi:MAG: DUF2279 domain-containing protein [Kofleriaceae bacterium]